VVKNGSDSGVSPPDEIRGLVGIPGDGRDLPTAIANAWENGKAQSGHRAYRVQEILVWGENPISGYRVILTPVG
jgi:hypothetical protein